MTDDRLARMTLEGFLDILGSDAPTPGGGAAGAVSGAIGAALIAMVGRLTVGKPGFEDVEDRMRALIEKADAARLAFLDLADRDAHAFDAVMVAFKLPKETDEDKAVRTSAIQDGYAHAASVPLEIARASVDVMELAEDATAFGNPQAASDGLSGAAHLYCAVICAIVSDPPPPRGRRCQPNSPETVISAPSCAPTPSHLTVTLER